MKYDFITERHTSQKIFKAGFNNTYPYDTDLATDIDFAVDELGLWLIYGSTKHNGRLTIAKIDPETLSTQDEWITKFRKNEAMSSFMVCGKLYIIVQDKNTMAAEIPLFYDVKTSTLVQLPTEKGLQLESESLYLTMVDYNPRGQQIFVWGLTRSYHGELILYNVSVESDEEEIDNVIDNAIEGL